MGRLAGLILLALTLWSCGGDNVGKDPKPGPCTGVNECVEGDGCCPSGCSSADDDDCSDENNENNSNNTTAECGNGVLEPGETCDGDCPTSCASNDPCTGLVLTGSADRCNVVCDEQPVTACVTGDMCCPELCSEDNDGDCVAGCGNGVLEPGELCDGDCPTACGDDNACTRDIYSGSASTCTAMCSFEEISVCQGGDGCCPTGCTEANDSDCNCVPERTCASVGAECGSIDNGCEVVACPNTCGANESCSQNTCIDVSGNAFVGDPCANDGQCAGFTNAYCETHVDFSGGYCSAPCQFDNDCPMGSHCARLFAGDPNQTKLCMKNCATDGDCRPNGYACQNWDSFDQNAQVSDECGPAATGNGQIGDPCTSLADCDGGECVTSVTTQTMGQVNFPGGSCTATCLPIIGGCPMGTACSDGLYCMPSCVTSLECRAGYTCQTSQFDGTQRYCWPQ